MMGSETGWSVGVALVNRPRLKVARRCWGACCGGFVYSGDLGLKDDLRRYEQKGKVQGCEWLK